VHRFYEISELLIKKDNQYRQISREILVTLYTLLDQVLSGRSHDLSLHHKALNDLNYGTEIIRRYRYRRKELRPPVMLPTKLIFYIYIYIYTERYIMFSVITNIYNKKTKAPTLMELFTATGKLRKFFFFLFDN